LSGNVRGKVLPRPHSFAVCSPRNDVRIPFNIQGRCLQTESRRKSRRKAKDEGKNVGCRYRNRQTRACQFPVATRVIRIPPNGIDDRVASCRDFTLLNRETLIIVHRIVDAIDKSRVMVRHRSDEFLVDGKYREIFPRPLSSGGCVNPYLSCLEKIARRTRPSARASGKEAKRQFGVRTDVTSRVSPGCRLSSVYLPRLNDF